MAERDYDMGNQNWATPLAFIDAFSARFGPIGFDLAASSENAKAEYYFTEEQDALKQDWLTAYRGCGGRWLWLNPPFADMAPLAEKVSEEARRGARIAMLHQVSLARWFVDYVVPNARTYLLSPRVRYVPPKGEERNPKTGKLRTGADFDSALSLFGPATRGSIEVWEWAKGGREGAGR